METGDTKVNDPMLTAGQETAANRTSFFRQSGWMMLTTVSSGVFMFAVHFLNQKISKAEYGILGALLQMINYMAIPTLGMQMIFAHQTSSAITEPQQRNLSSMMRAVLMGTFVIWAIMAVVMLLFQNRILNALQIPNPAALWVTVMVGLMMLWQPIVFGVLQGLQNFLWLGWAQVSNGLGRFLPALVIVLFISSSAAGIITGALIGLAVAVLLAAWHTRKVWLGGVGVFEWQRWLKQVVPLTLGYGAAQIMLSADMIVVQYLFPGDTTGSYTSISTLGRALVAFTAPISSVMFPKIVRSAALNKKTDLLLVALLVTGGLAGMGALGLWVMAPWIMKLVFSQFIEATPLLPWFAWCMLPLAMSNVLINNLMACSRFRAVLWMVAVVAAYLMALSYFNHSFLTIIKTMGVFNLLLLVVCIYFTWGVKKTASASAHETQLP
jgi:O-antigen/teichoic acid export membrane protein